jgi:putative transposase
MDILLYEVSAQRGDAQVFSFSDQAQVWHLNWHLPELDLWQRLPSTNAGFVVQFFGMGSNASSRPKVDTPSETAVLLTTDQVIEMLQISVTHADAGSQFTSVRFTERLDEIGALPSIGTVADSYDTALAETTNGVFKTECIYGPDAPRRWADVGEVELATLTWVHWFNEHRLHSHCGDIPPAEFEAAFYAAPQPAPAGVGNQ